jgi:hypothetical protein
LAFPWRVVEAVVQHMEEHHLAGLLEISA